jgi:hypothetical protein
VPGYVQDLEVQIELREISRVAFAQRTRLAGHFFPGGSEDRNAVSTQQAIHAANVVGVTMRDENARQLKSARQFLFDRLCVPWIHRDYSRRIPRRMDEPNVVVGKRANSRNLQHMGSK